ncbi:MAG: cephalosporin hydroxylase [Elusimicrobia bacterium RIFOXYB2_FULL_49_7]|nr:MAG: cephalosporin hydroxylase [Elusimicrobia bacterium RIFOXYB2_FULL_49_7]
MPGTLKDLSKTWIREATRQKNGFSFMTWLGRPILQIGSDLMALQEIIWNLKPEFIIETGIAHGGSTIFYASMLELLGGSGKVISIDIEIRDHNRKAIEEHPLSKRVELIQGSSIDPATVAKVAALVNQRSALVILDSNHTHDHVLEELRLFSPFVRKGSYLIVFDTAIDDMPDDFFPDRPWKKGNSPKSAVHQFLKENNRFVIDTAIEEKILLTVAPDGFLKCIE